MAGERLCATGQPATAVSTGLALSGRLSALLRARAVVLRDVALELGVGRGEGMRAVPAGLHDVEQVVVARGVRRRSQRREAGIADRAGRQPLVRARVVAGVD